MKSEIPEKLRGKQLAINLVNLTLPSQLDRTCPIAIKLLQNQSLQA